MTEGEFAEPGDLRIDLHRVDGVWYAHLAETTLWAKGDTPEQAMTGLSERRGQYRSFTDATGVQPVDLLVERPEPGSVRRAFFRVARVVAIVALCAIPISYGLSTGIERGVEEAAKSLRFRDAMRDLEQGILDLGRPENDLDPQRAEALGNAVGRIVERIRPFTAPAGTLFNQSSAQGDNDDR